MKFINWLMSLLKKKETPPSVIVKPVEPIPEIPTQEEVENFPKKQIEDFKFVDSSHYHDYVDPTKYKAPFLSHKCTQGTAIIDPKWPMTKKICKDNKIPLSGYHFFECKQDAIQQVEHYMDSHGDFELAPQVDFETYKTKYSEQTEKDLINNVEKLYVVLCELKKRTGKTPILYLNYAFALRANLPSKFAEFIAWFARYNSFLGPIPAPWTTNTTGMWQFTEEGSFPGFPDGNDVNIYYGKVNALNLK